MPIAVLLLREDASTSLKILVEKSQQKKTLLPEYDLQLTNNQLDLILTSKPERYIKSTSTDEGFESDIDSLSIVSSDDSFTINNIQDNVSKTQETDSANGSASSDSDDTECLPGTSKDNASKNVDTTNTHSPEIRHEITNKSSNENNQICKETFNLVDCICYTDVKFPNILVFVIKKEALVFRFDNLKILQSFYVNFTSLKAVANQQTYNRNIINGTKFNLLQRTDNNGVTHIEITRESKPGIFLYHNETDGPSSIISINTPEDNLFVERERSKTLDVRSINKESKIKNANLRQRSESIFVQDKSNSINNNSTKNSHELLNTTATEKAITSETLLDNLLVNNNETALKKTWNSAENLLDMPKRPERRRKTKGKAPQPPQNNTTDYENNDINKDIFSGQFVRVNVNFDLLSNENQKQLLLKSHQKEPHPKKLQNFKLLSTKPNLPNFLTTKPKLQTYDQFKHSDTKPIGESSTLQRNRFKNDSSSWTNSVPRLLKKPRSKSETRNFTPMAYRYIDTTQNYPTSYNSNNNNTLTRGNTSNSHINSFVFSTNYLGTSSNSQTISNRLFGMSPKLKEFNSTDNKNDSRWNSLGDLSGRNDNSNLKSVIKKDENKKKNEKKVTFSAYTTVQVV